MPVIDYFYDNNKNILEVIGIKVIIILKVIGM